MQLGFPPISRAPAVEPAMMERSALGCGQLVSIEARTIIKTTHLSLRVLACRGHCDNGGIYEGWRTSGFGDTTTGCGSPTLRNMHVRFYILHLMRNSQENGGTSCHSTGCYPSIQHPMLLLIFLGFVFFFLSFVL